MSDVGTLPELDSSPTRAQGGAVIELRGVTVAYGTQRALDAVDLRVDAGDFLAMLGPNGAGKTTLMRAVWGRIDPGAGAVRLFGEDPRTSPRARSRIGLVPQQIALYPHLTTRENLDVFARLAGVAPNAVAAAVDRALVLTKLTDRANDRLSTLSGGSQRRTNIAAAILHAPALLLLDEPTVGVDVEARHAIHSTLRSLHDSGVTIVLVTHDFEQAQVLANRVVFMLAGRPVLDGHPAQLLRNAFAGRKELVVELNDVELSAAQRSVLERDGFSPTEAGAVWVARARHGYADLSACGERLEAAALPLKEIRVRQPNLESLMLHLTREAAPRP